MNFSIDYSHRAFLFLTIAMAGLLVSTFPAWADSPTVEEPNSSPSTLSEEVEVEAEEEIKKPVAPALRMGAQTLAGAAALGLAFGGGALIHESFFFAGFYVGLPLAIYATGHLLGGEGGFIYTFAGMVLGMGVVGLPVFYALFEMNGPEWLLALPSVGAVAGGVAGYWYSSPRERRRSIRGPRLFYLNTGAPNDDNRFFLGIRGSF